MTVTWTEGFDMYNGTGAGTGVLAKASAVWTSYSASATALTAGRFGGQCVQLNLGPNYGGYSGTGGSGTVDSGVRFIFNGSGQSSGAVGFAFYSTTSSPGSSSGFGSFEPLLVLQDLSFNFQFTVGRNLGGFWELHAGATGALLGTSTTAVVANTWQYVELAFQVGSSSTLTLSVAGTVVLTVTGANTNPTGAGVVGAFICAACNVGNFAHTNYFDDMYVNSTNSVLGESRVETLRPASDSTKVWTPKTGTTNYNQVNETLVDGDTSYVQTATTGITDRYTVGGLSSTPANIWAVNVVSFAEKTDATTRQLFNSVQSGATVSDGAAFNLNTGYQRFDRLIQNDPNTSAAWTPSGVNNLLIGPKAA